MNNSIVKWVFLPVTIILIVITLIGVSMLSTQSEQLEEADTQISSLEAQLSTAVEQISSLQNEISEVNSLASSVASLEATVQNLGGQTSTVTESVNIADVVAEVKSSVVAINTTYTYTLWGRYYYTEEGAGSGWIIDESGIIVTNYHVVDGADSISVTLDDGRVCDVDTSTVYYDEEADLAIFKIDADNLQAAATGDSTQLRIGDWVVTLGNSLDMGVSAKEGIISQMNVSIDVENQTLSGLIETSAAINAGNSGGILINMNGEVVGITNAKVSSVGVEGMGYAININDAMTVIEELIAEMAAA
jgi:S1-C subfamily serine protease